jgi:alginate O-acetyltransferase complex protein AlgI
MLFTEPYFLFLFLPLTLTAYYASPKRARNTVLSLASLVFYALGEWRFLGWLVASVAVNYWIARGIEVSRGTARARALLTLGVVSDLALLIVFKYAGFLVRGLDGVLAVVGLPQLRPPELLLPLGISFFTFHKISYKVDVYRGQAEAKKSPIDLALYILLFPQLIAGPIVRFNEIAGELVHRTTTRKNFADGVGRFVVGLAKKMIIANTVAVCADEVFSIASSQLTAGVAWLGIVCYAIQIYFDFSGYSDMAIGLALMFGFHFPENFDHPYVSASITEFWRRWHMSLSRWFRDYLYIPMGGNQGSPARTYFNLVTVFFLCGLWHGASKKFVVWGMFHGVLLVIERVRVGQVLAVFPAPVRHAYTLLMVLVGWVFFRADTLSYALTYLATMFGLGRARDVPYFPSTYLDVELLAVLAVGIVASAPLRVSLLAEARRLAASVEGARGRALGAAVDCSAAAVMAGLFVWSVMSIAAGTYNPFIYFRF